MNVVAFQKAMDDAQVDFESGEEDVPHDFDSLEEWAVEFLGRYLRYAGKP